MAWVYSMWLCEKYIKLHAVGQYYSHMRRKQWNLNMVRHFHMFHLLLILGIDNIVNWHVELLIICKWFYFSTLLFLTLSLVHTVNVHMKWFQRSRQGACLFCWVPGTQWVSKLVFKSPWIFPQTYQHFQVKKSILEPIFRTKIFPANFFICLLLIYRFLFCLMLSPFFPVEEL